MQITKTLLLVASLFLGLTFSISNLAAPGDLDTAFGTGGIVETSFGNSDRDVDLALQADGKIVVLQTLTDPTNSIGNDFAFARYNTDGSLDTTFGTGGKVILAQTGDQTAGGIAVQSDGKIVAVGYEIASGIETTNLLVYRLNPDGTLDTSFGTGGKVTPNLGGQSIGKDVVIQPDGKIAIAGQYTAGNFSRMAVFRLNSAGTLDTSFNSTGYNSIIFPQSVAGIGNAIALQNDGRIIVGGSLAGNGGRFAIVNSDGTRVNMEPSLTSSNVYINEIAIQPDGKILLAGQTREYFPTTVFAVTRLNADKTQDLSFGVNGFCRVNWGVTQQDDATSLVVEPNGSIIIGGNSIPNGSTKASIVRINAYGALDFGFGTNGKIVTDFNNLSKLIRQPDGKILAFASINRDPPNERNLIVARYLSGTSTTFPNRTRFDFDGDGKADIAVYRQSNSYWYILRSTDNSFQFTYWGLATDQVVPADYDGDGKTDIAVYREDLRWYVLRSSDNTFMMIFRVGVGGNPLPADFDGDRIDDTSVYLSDFWQYGPTTHKTNTVQVIFGDSNAKRYNADYDGDGRADVALFYPSNGNWKIRYATGIINSSINFGLSTDIPVTADFDGDGKTDVAVFRPSVGDWYWLNSSTGSFSGVHWGADGDKPVVADYDGDRIDDFAVFRPSDGTWYIYQSTAGFKAVNWGLSTDIPIPNIYVR